MKIPLLLVLLTGLLLILPVARAQERAAAREPSPASQPATTESASPTPSPEPSQRSTVYPGYPGHPLDPADVEVLTGKRERELNRSRLGQGAYLAGYRGYGYGYEYGSLGEYGAGRGRGRGRTHSGFGFGWGFRGGRGAGPIVFQPPFRFGGGLFFPFANSSPRGFGSRSFRGR